MPDKTSPREDDKAAPARPPAPADGKTTKVDEKTQKDAAVEREKTGGYE